MNNDDDLAQNLAAHIRQLCGYPKSESARKNAMEFLARHDLQGSILRSHPNYKSISPDLLDWWKWFHDTLDEANLAIGQKGETLPAEARLAHLIDSLNGGKLPLPVPEGMVPFFVRVFTLGCFHGHNSTVEGHYTHVVTSEIDTHYEEKVREILKDL